MGYVYVFYFLKMINRCGVMWGESNAQSWLQDSY